MYYTHLEAQGWRVGALGSFVQCGLCTPTEPVCPAAVCGEHASASPYRCARVMRNMCWQRGHGEEISRRKNRPGAAHSSASGECRRSRSADTDHGPSHDMQRSHALLRYASGRGRAGEGAPVPPSRPSTHDGVGAGSHTKRAPKRARREARGRRSQKRPRPCSSGKSPGPSYVSARVDSSSAARSRRRPTQSVRPRRRVRETGRRGVAA